MRDEAEARLARDDFIVLFFADRDAGVVRTEAEYRQIYAGFEDVVSEELRRLSSQGDKASPAPAAPARDEPRARHAWTLGRYRIERELGRGGQGTVFLAYDTKLDRHVALKLLKPTWSGFSSMVRRFEREAQALARIDHPGLATVHDAGAAHGAEYLVMPYVEGCTLAQELASRDLSVPLGRADVLRCVTIVEKAARALHVAHEAGLVHRDVKPGNIMVGAGDEPVVLDFGLAFFRELEAEKLTITGDILGTAPFMAPEQVAGARDRVDRRTDVFALAATLRALLPDAGRPSSAVPRDLVAVLDAGSHPDPDRRYATAEAFADDLARIRRGEPVTVKPLGSLRKLLTWCRRAPAVAALVTIPPLAVIGGLVGLSFKNASIRAASAALERREVEASAAARLATERFNDFQRLNDLRRIQDLEERERALWPPRPDATPAIERWLADAREVLGRLPQHRAALETLRRESPAPASRPGGSFPRADDRWLAENLGALVERLDALASTAAHGCTVTAVLRKLEAARSIGTTTLVEPAAKWREAIAAIAADPRYGGLRMTPMLGLVPIGRDPGSGLQEFAHVLSGAAPARDSAGRLAFGAESSIVLVLVPPGAAKMGAEQPIHPDEPAIDHVDPAAEESEGPVHQIALDAFFISKYEMTQAQWVRATGSNPSHHRAGRPWAEGYLPSPLCPVESVSHDDAALVLRQIGLTMPTEAQWEHAARAGTTTPWWTGPAAESVLANERLLDHAGIAPEASARLEKERPAGWFAPAAVGMQSPNPFGLHDVGGNVREHCRDRWNTYGAPPLPGDGLRPYPNLSMTLRVVRGGGFNDPARAGRSSTRHRIQQTNVTPTVGVRPALSLTAP
jgi:formylglycine-generating enzyme required for sulfatase activity